MMPGHDEKPVNIDQIRALLKQKRRSMKLRLAACAGCHNPAGKGNALAGFPRVGGQQADYVKLQLQAFRAAGRNDNVADPAGKRSNDAVKAGELGPMQMVAARMSDAEIDAVSSYISGLY